METNRTARFEALAFILFWVLVAQGLALGTYLLLVTGESPLFTLPIFKNPISELGVFALTFIFSISALAFLILPADLTYEKTKDEKEKALALLTMLALPWLDLLFGLVSDNSFSLQNAIGKTAVLWYCGGLLAYMSGIVFLGQNQKKTRSPLLLAIPFLILSTFIYQNIWAYGWFTNQLDLLVWHGSLFLYTYSVFKNLRNTQQD
jgi:hypothetical protein